MFGSSKKQYSFGTPWPARHAEHDRSNPGLDLVVVVTAGNYNQRDAWKLPVAIITEIVLPGLRVE